MVMNPEQGGFVFISHSHLDIRKVRQIRNALEAAGFEPLCFYLKCLSDDDEIEGLIKREIDAREWFVYIDSPNARASSWVAKERKYIESSGDKQIVQVNLDSPFSMDEISAMLIRGLRICLVCAEADRSLAEEFRNFFVRKDMQASVRVVGLPPEALREDEAGCVVPILSDTGLRESHLAALFSGTDRGKTRIIPLLTGTMAEARQESLHEQFEAVYYLKNRENLQTKEEIGRRIETVMTHDMRKAFSRARSHSEVESYLLDSPDDPELRRMAEEAHDRLEEERRIREDIEAQVERGFMKMTPELKKYLDSLY